MALLVEQKRLIAEGSGRGRRYRLPSGDVVFSPPAGKLTLKGYASHTEVYPPPFVLRERSSNRLSASRFRSAIQSDITGPFPMTTDPTIPFISSGRNTTASSRDGAQVWEFILDQIVACESAKDIPTLEELRKRVKQFGLL